MLSSGSGAEPWAHAGRSLELDPRDGGALSQTRYSIRSLLLPQVPTIEQVAPNQRTKHPEAAA